MSSIHFFAGQVWVERLGLTLVHFLWQGLLIAAVYASARRWLGASRGPQARYLLACFALVALIAAPIVTFAVLAAPESAVANPHVGSVPPTSTGYRAAPESVPALPFLATRAWHDVVMPWLVMVWLAGAIVFWVRMMGGWVVAERMRRMLIRPAPQEWQSRLDEISARLRVSRSVQLLTSALVQVPTVVGWLRPVVLMPVGALAGLPAEHVEALLAHELAHIRRHDYLVNILQSVAEALLFYHPAVWWVSKQVRDEREHCCDDVAVAVSGDALDYVRALADLESRRPVHFAPALAADGGSLPDRVARLLGMPVRASRPMPGSGSIVAAALIVSAAYGLFAQPGAIRQAFEVASIRPDPSGSTTSSGVSTRDGRLSATNVTVRRLIQSAYETNDFLIVGGPAWLGTERYDVEAKAEATASGSSGHTDYDSMLQTLLGERFAMKIHRETKELPVYILTLAKDGPKFAAHTGGGGASTNMSHGAGKAGLVATAVTMPGLAERLGRELGRAVIDRTGLAGEYDVKLEWSPDQAAESSGPSIFTALPEQLGLRLQAGKGPVEVLVIDSVERPSEN